MTRVVVVISCTLSAAAGLLWACASPSTSDAFVATVYHTPSSDASEAGEFLLNPADAGGRPASLIQGSPLCNASLASGVCYPDDPATAGACGLSPDGGAYDPSASYDASVLACHVVNEGGFPSAPTTACLVTGTGDAGSGCEASTECAATEECVGAGMCRRYCCSAPCDPQEFCDIQPETQDPTLIVPVCLPIQPCALLQPSDAGGCPPMQTCSAFVGEGGVGVTTCVAVGPANEGDSCESQHCAAGLVCIGAWGERRCYALCDTDAAAACAPPETCSGGLPLFPAPGIGVCQTTVGPDR